MRRSPERLARAYALSLAVGFAAAAAPALRLRTVRPSWRELSVIAAASVGMGFAIHPPLLAAALSLAAGGGVFVAIMFAPDVGGVAHLPLSIYARRGSALPRRREGQDGAPRIRRRSLFPPPRPC